MRQQPQSPQDQPGPLDVGAPTASAQHHCADAGDRGEGDQPGDLAAENVVEKPSGARGATEVGAASTAAPAGTAAAAGDPGQAVVAGDQVPDGVLGAAADEGAVGGGDRVHGHHPPAAGDHQGHPRDQQGTDPGPERAARGEEVGHEEGRQHHVGGQHLGVEGEADQDRRPHQRHGATAADRLQAEPGGGDGEQDQHRVGVVVAVDRHGDRRDRQHQCGHGGRRVAEAAPHRAVEHADGGDPGQCDRQQHLPAAEAEDPAGELHQPERERRFVDGDEVAGVQRAEERRRPALGAAEDGCRVVRVGVAVPAEAVAVDGGRQQQHAPQGGAGPAGGVLVAEQDALRQAAPRPAAPGRPASARAGLRFRGRRRGLGRCGHRWLSSWGVARSVVP